MYHRAGRWATHGSEVAAAGPTGPSTVTDYDRLGEAQGIQTKEIDRDGSWVKQSDAMAAMAKKRAK